MTTSPRRRFSLVLGGLAAAAVTVTGLAAPAQGVSDRARVPSLEFRGEGALAAGLQFQGTTVGGLSSITYDASRDVYYAISDARPEIGQGPFRFYTLRIDVADGALDADDVTVTAVTTLKQADGTAFPPGSLDPEGLSLTKQGTLVFSSEGFVTPAPVPPRVLEFALNGTMLREIALPAYTAPGPGVGVRQNLGIEAVAVSPNGQFLFAGFENALVQDGSAASIDSGSPVRLLRWSPRNGPHREYVYVTDRVAEPSTGFSVNGLVELLPMNTQFLLAMERSFSVGGTGLGNTIKLYRAALPGATDVSGVADLDDAGGVRPVRKRLLLNLSTTPGIPILDNMEGMTLGPRLADGGRALVLVSDNNFTAGQQSQFLLFAADKVGRR